MIRGCQRARDRRTLIVAPAPQRLHAPANLLRLEPLLACRRLWLRRPALAWLSRRLRDQLVQTFARSLAIARLRAMLAAVDDQHAVGVDAAAGEPEQSILDVLWKR